QLFLLNCHWGTLTNQHITPGPIFCPPLDDLQTTALDPTMELVKLRIWPTLLRHLRIKPTAVIILHFESLFRVGASKEVAPILNRIFLLELLIDPHRCISDETLQLIVSLPRM